MSNPGFRAGVAAVGVLATVLFVNAAQAEDRHERDRHENEQHAERHDQPRVQHFDDHRRTAVREYYVKEYHGRRCPPGFAHHGNECGPTHYERKWQMGHPLPRTVIYHTVPPQLVTELGPPPPGHKYVRVASDILLIAVSTGLVVDAINDLGR